ncbi:hypothetical protein WMZ97_06465 [Lentibacillus sp. N15]|uniref:hypothetical protein n=1 Tax=Lentibacillus songyuanensis TaxID=3136161 RepID=UPI0031BB1767
MMTLQISNRKSSIVSLKPMLQTHERGCRSRSEKHRPKNERIDRRAKNIDPRMSASTEERETSTREWADRPKM